MRAELHGITAAHAHVLSGMSGSAVWLVSDDGERWRVRKIAETVECSARLKFQLAKQVELDGRDSAPVRVPKVLDSGYHGDRFWFEMDFVHGIDGPTYLRRAGVDQVRAFTAAIQRYLEWAASTAPAVVGAGRGDLFDGLFDRVCHVQERTRAVPTAAFEQLMMAMARIRMLDIVPSWCHGDLTLENLQVGHDGSIWLFDLLDAPHEHVWQDVAKLHQDLVGGWYRRNHDSISPATLDHIGRRLVETAVSLDERYQLVHHLLIAVCFVRILPYTTEAEDREVAVRGLVHFANLAIKE